MRDFAPDAPDELGIMIVAHRAPPLPFLSAEDYGAPVLGLLLVWSGDIAAGLRATAPLRAVGTPLGDLVRPVPYRAVQSLIDGSAPHGTHAYWRSHRLPELSDAVIDTHRRARRDRPPRRSRCSTAGRSAAPRAASLRTRPPSASARWLRAAHHRGVWPPGDPDGERHTAWVRDGWESLRPHSAGRQYVNFLSDEGAAGVQAAYGDRLARLVALKDRYDPTNVFRLNVNIPPSDGVTR